MMKQLKCRMCGKVFSEDEIDYAIYQSAGRDFPRCESPEAGTKPFVDSGIGGHLLRDVDDEFAKTADIEAEAPIATPSKEAVELSQLLAENSRLTAALHANRCHPDYSYIVRRADGDCEMLADLGLFEWDRNPEYVCAPGDECWRKKKRSVSYDVF